MSGWGSKGFRMTSLGPGKKEHFLVFSLKNYQKSVSLEPFIGLLAFVVGKLWPKKQ